MLKYEITLNECDRDSAEEWTETYDTLDQALARVENAKKKNATRSMSDRSYSLEVVGGIRKVRAKIGDYHGNY
jgi:hypothetical protein